MKTIIRFLLRLFILAVIFNGFVLTENSHAFINDATQIVSTSIQDSPDEQQVLQARTQTFRETLSFNKFPPELGELQRVEIQYRSIVDRYQYTVAVCGPVEDCLVDEIENRLVVVNAFFDISTPHFSAIRFLDVPNEIGPDTLGFEKDCNLQRSCSHTKTGTRGFPLPDPVIITSPSVLADFTGSGTIDIDFVIELFNTADGWCRPTGYFYDYYSCRDFASSGGHTSFDWEAEATIKYVFEVATAEGFGCPSPVASAGGPYSGTTGAPISFDASSSYTECGEFGVFIVEYAWDFDSDGTYDSRTSTPFATHTYDTCFSGDTRLMVSDSLGWTGFDTAPVQVTSSPSQGDFDGDCDVDYTDFALLLDTFDKCEGDPAYDETADLNGDGCVNCSDYQEFFGFFPEAASSAHFAVEYDWGDPPPGYSIADWPIFESWMNVRLENIGAVDAEYVTATILAAPENCQIVDGDVTVGNVAAGSSAWSSDTFRIRVDTSNPQDPDEGIFWKVEYDADGVHFVEVVPEFPGAVFCDE